MLKYEEINEIAKQMKEQIVIAQLQKRVITESEFLKLLKFLSKKCEDIKEVCQR